MKSPSKSKVLSLSLRVILLRINKLDSFKVCTCFLILLEKVKEMQKYSDTSWEKCLRIFQLRGAVCLAKETSWPGYIFEAFDANSIPYTSQGPSPRLDSKVSVPSHHVSISITSDRRRESNGRNCRSVGDRAMRKFRRNTGGQGRGTHYICFLRE